MKKLALRLGMDLPRFGNGLVAGRDANEFIMKILQAFVRLQVRNGSAADPKVTLSDSNLIIELPNGSGGSSGVASSLFVGTLTSVSPDYLTCSPYSELTQTATGSLPVIVAKEAKHRCSSLYNGNPSSANPAVVLGVSHTYTFANNIDANGINNVTRTDSYSSTTEDQRIIPPWVFGDIIYAISCPSIVVDTTTTPNTTTNWLYYAGSRQWAKI